MNEKQIENLSKAMSKLSDEEQEQIAAAGKINSGQCEKINKLAAGNQEEMGKYAIISYGVSIPGIDSGLVVRDDTKKINWQDTMMKGDVDTFKPTIETY